MALLSKAKAAKENPAPANGAIGSQLAPPLSGAAVTFTAKMAEQNKFYKLPNGSVAMFICTAGMTGSTSKFSFIPVDANGTPTGTPQLLEADIPVTPTVVAPPATAKTEEKKPEPIAATPTDVTPTPAPAATETPAPKPEKKKKMLIQQQEPTASATKATSAKPAAENISLYVNCIPNIAYRPLDPYIAQMASALAEIHKVDDIRFPPNGDHAMSFQRWEGALAAAVRKAPPENGAYVAFTRDRLTDVVVSALIPIAGTVVRGVVT